MELNISFTESVRMFAAALIAVSVGATFNDMLRWKRVTLRGSESRCVTKQI